MLKKLHTKENENFQFSTSNLNKNRNKNATEYFLPRKYSLAFYLERMFIRIVKKAGWLLFYVLERSNCFDDPRNIKMPKKSMCANQQLMLLILLVLLMRLPDIDALAATATGSSIHFSYPVDRQKY